MKHLHVHELHTFVEAQAGAGHRPLLLDVREPWEVAIAAIALPGADGRNVPLMQLPEQCDGIDRSQPVVCICHHGVRSRQAVAFLMQHGFDSVYNLAGGIEAWSMEVDPATARY